jgi:hypothetical protein
MTTRRVVVLVTAVLVAGLAVAFAVAGWDQVDGIAAMTSALATVGALGAGIWAAMPGAHPGGHTTGTASTTPRPRLTPHVPEAALATASLTLAALIVCAVRWPTTLLTWPAAVAGLAATLLSVPLLWVRSPRGHSGWRAEALFAAALTASLLGAAFVGCGSAGALRDSGSGAWSGSSPPASGRGGGSDGSPKDEPPTRPAPRHGKIPLKVGYQIDLDSTAPDWGVVKTGDYSDGHIESDLAVGLGSIAATHKAQLARSTSTTYDACRSATAFDHRIESDDEAALNATACLRTGQGRVAAVQVTKVTRDSIGFFDEVELTVTVW